MYANDNNLTDNPYICLDCITNNDQATNKTTDIFPKHIIKNKTLKDINSNGILNAQLLANDKNNKQLSTQEINDALAILSQERQSNDENTIFSFMDILTNAYSTELLEIYTNKRLNPMVEKTPDPVLKYLVEWEMNWTSKFKNTREHPSAIFFPGKAGNSEIKITKTLSINCSVDGNYKKFIYSGPNNVVWVSTGLYANAGEIVKITIPNNLVNNLYLVIGCHRDNLSNNKTSLMRFPVVSRQYLLENTINEFTPVFGGLTYIGVKPFSRYGLMDVTIEGCYESPTYFIDKTTNSEWNQLKIKMFHGEKL